MTAFNLADLFEIVADACPDRTALVAGDVRLTYRQLDERATRVANHLLDAGVRPGQHVGVLGYNRAEWLETMIGCFKARVAPVNVNYRYIKDELSHLLGDSECVALVAEADLLENVNRTDLPLLRHVVAVGGPAPKAEEYEDALASASPSRAEVLERTGERSGDDPYLLYTGGTTGLPKGVLWRSEDIFFSAMGGGNHGGTPIADPSELSVAAEREGLRAQVHAPLMHGGGQWITWITLTTGGTVILYTGRRFDAAESLELASRERTQILMLVGNGMGHPVAEELSARRYDLEVFAFGSGGAPLSDEVRAKLLAVVPNAYVSDNLGGSETGAMGPSLGGGRFQLHPQLAVLSDDLLPVAPGETGILARTGNIPVGYWKDEKKTAATFRTGPDGRRWALQGDYARLNEDGTVTLLGRGSLVINTGGEKVFTEEVEAALRTCPGVTDAIVVALPDERLGSKVAAVVAGTAAEEDLRAHCRTLLAGYKIPRVLAVVPEIQLTAVGKPDYAWARTRF